MLVFNNNNDPNRTKNKREMKTLITLIVMQLFAHYKTKREKYRIVKHRVIFWLIFIQCLQSKNQSSSKFMSILNVDDRNMLCILFAVCTCGCYFFFFLLNIFNMCIITYLFWFNKQIFFIVHLNNTKNNETIKKSNLWWYNQHGNECCFWLVW